MSDNYDGSDYERALLAVKKKLDDDIHSLFHKGKLLVLLEQLKLTERARKAHG